jgi:hypothetical protein
MEKRAILAIVLSMLILIAYQRWFLREQPKKREEPKEVESIEPIAPGEKTGTYAWKRDYIRLLFPVMVAG